MDTGSADAGRSRTGAGTAGSEPETDGREDADPDAGEAARFREAGDSGQQLEQALPTVAEVVDRGWASRVGNAESSG